LDVGGWLLTVLLWGLIGYWAATVRRIRRLERDTEAIRAQVAANLARSEQLLAGLDQFAPWRDLRDDPAPQVH